MRTVLSSCPVINRRLSGVKTTHKMPWALMSNRQSVAWFTSVTCDAFRRSSRYLPLREIAVAVTMADGRTTAGSLAVVKDVSMALVADILEELSAGDAGASAALGPVVTSDGSFVVLVVCD